MNPNVLRPKRHKLFYFVHVPLFFFVFIPSILMVPVLAKRSAMDFSSPPLFLMYTLTILSGALLGLESLRWGKEQGGKWNFHLPKFLVFVLPTAYLAFYPWIFYSLKGLALPIGNANDYLLETYPVFLMVLGFFIIRCFEKDAPEANQT